MSQTRETAGQLELLLVLSDLHLSAPGPHGRPALFQDGPALKEFLEAAARIERQVLLVLNGDTFDFLSVPGYGYFEANQASAHLAVILAERNVELVRQGLLEFLKDPRHGVKFTVGNHDPELGLEAVKAAIRAWLEDAEGRQVGFHPLDGSLLDLRVGERQVRLSHGNYSDPWNRIEPGALERASTAGLELPPGSRLVLDVLRDLRRVVPFVDLIKPELNRLFFVLWYLAPTTVQGSFLDALAARLDAGHEQFRFFWDRVKRAFSRKKGEHALLGAGGGDAMDEWLDEQLERIELDPEDWDAAVASGLKEYIEKGNSAFGSEGFMKSSDSAVLEGLASWAVRSLSEHEASFFDPTVPDGLWPAARERWAAGRTAVLAGHTHSARHVRQTAGRHELDYINTGTWTRLIRFSELGRLEASLELRGWKELVDALEEAREPPGTPQTGELIATYAEVRPDAVLLRRWPAHVPGQGTAALEHGVQEGAR